MDQLIELLQQIKELAGVAIDALKGGGEGEHKGGPPHEGGAPHEGGPPPHEGGPPPEGPPPGQ